MKSCLLVVLFVFLTSVARASSIPEVDMKEVVYAPRPNYPFEARKRNLEGCGRFILHVRTDGTIARVDVEGSTGASLLDHTAIDVYIKWRFKAGRARAVGATCCFTMRPYPYMPKYRPPAGG